MIGFIIFILFVLAALGALATINSFFVRISSWTKSYSRLAERYGSRVTYSRFRPRLSFKYAGSSCLLKSSGRRKNKQTQLQTSGPARSLAALMVLNWMIANGEDEFPSDAVMASLVV